MKHRFYLLGFLIALVLVMLLPVAAHAATRDFFASGTVGQISTSNEQPAGSSGRIVVYERSVAGDFITGDILGPYTVVYKANVELATQAGSMSGTLSSGAYTFTINGKSEPLTWVPVEGGVVGQLRITGNWQSITQKVDGYGTFAAEVWFVPSLDGHINQILPGSNFNLSGQIKAG